MDICTNADSLKIILIFKTIMQILRIIGPIVLLIMLGVDIFKAVSGGEKELREMYGFAIKRIIAAVCIFLIPVFINIIVSTVSAVTSNDYVLCITNATKERIETLYETTAEEKIFKAKTTLSDTDYKAALEALYKIKDKDLYDSLYKQLQEVGVIIEANKLILNAETLLTSSSYNLALNAVKKITDENIKSNYTTRLSNINLIVKAKEALQKAQSVRTQEAYNTALTAINKIKDSKIKQTYLNQLNSIKIGEEPGTEPVDPGTSTEPSKPGDPLNLQSSFTKYSDSTYSPLLGYYLYIPKNATSNMPLVVSLPPNNLSGSVITESDVSNLKAFVYIPILSNWKPRDYNPNVTDWDMTASAAAIKKIKDLVKQYKIDESRISLTAYSSSGYYIYLIANQYRIFSAIAPISSGLEFSKIQNYGDWTYLKTLPMKGYGEKGGSTTANGRACSSDNTVSWSAKNAMCSGNGSGVFEGLGKCSNCDNCTYFTYMKDACHGEMGRAVLSIDNNNNKVPDVLEWMISQKKK